MESGIRRANSSLRLTVLLLLVSALLFAAAYIKEPVSGEAAAATQDVTRIESRISQLEQRFYSIELSIRGLEQQVRFSSVNRGGAEREAELGLLRSEVEALRRRIAEVECGLARVDERTLTAAAREARRRTGAGAGEPCRLNINAPLQLPVR